GHHAEKDQRADHERARAHQVEAQQLGYKCSSLTTHCGVPFDCRQSLPTYSPISPRKMICTPEKKRIDTITEVQPICRVGSSSFCTMKRAAATKLNKVTAMPNRANSRSGLMEKLMNMLSHSDTRRPSV